MRPSKQIKPVSFVEENARHLADVLDESGEPLILTENGEAKIVVQSVKAYEETQETIAFLKIMLLELRRSRDTPGIPLSEARERLMRRINER